MACRPEQPVLEHEFDLIFNKYPLDWIQSLKFQPLCGTGERGQNKEVHVEKLILVFMPFILYCCSVGVKASSIFLLQLESRVTFHEHLLPVCLPPPNYELAPGTVCTVIGWGKRADRDGEYWQYRICCIVSAVHHLLYNACSTASAVWCLMYSICCIVSAV